MTDNSQQRIDQLERDTRWWKRIAIGFMLTFVLIIAAGGVTSVALTIKARRAAEVAYREAERAQQEARQQHLKAQLEAEKAKR
jgi:hypothetical protein